MTVLSAGKVEIAQRLIEDGLARWKESGLMPSNPNSTFKEPFSFAIAPLR